jgi:hypothetical protein
LTPFVKVTVAAAFASLAVAFSCKTFDLPEEICDARALAGPLLASLQTGGACTRCVEDSCCDAVGACQNKARCFEIVKGVHECTLDAGRAGASAESECAKDGGLDRDAGVEADDTYRCMRDRCGSQCGLPVCRVDPAAGLILNVRCDQCFSSSCCPELNRCYGNRACKLALECITEKCEPSLAADLLDDEITGGPARALDAGLIDPRSFCDDAGPVLGDGGGAPRCVRTCLCQFATGDPGLEPLDPGTQPFALALGVYACAASASCGKACGP